MLDLQLFQIRLDRGDTLVPGCLPYTCHSKDLADTSMFIMGDPNGTTQGSVPVRHGPAGTVLLLTPSLDSIKKELKWGFLLHTYGFACLFFILAFYAFFSILNLRSLISARPFMSTINGFICLLGASRAGCLFIDPYNLKETMPKVIGSVMWDVGFPCVSSAFCLIQLAFLQLTQLKLGPEKMRRKSCLSLIITAHFSFTIGADIVVSFQDHTLVLKYAVQTVFLFWGIFLCCTFLYGGYRVMTLLRNMPGSLLQREPLDRNTKGIMQLAMLAPYNNLASSVAAALVPTLLTPKIRITDENDQTFSYGSDSNSLPAQGAQQEDEVSVGGDFCTSPQLLLGRASIRPGSPDPRRRSMANSTVPTVSVRPPTPTIVVSPSSRRTSLASRRGSEFESGSRRGSAANSPTNQGREGLDRRFSSDGSRRGSEASRRGSDCAANNCSSISEDKDVSISLVSSTANNIVRKKSGSWQQQHRGDQPEPSSPRERSFRNKRLEQPEDEVTAETSLLPQADDYIRRERTTGELTLQSILNHIAYVNRSSQNLEVSPPTNRKSQVQKVLHVTYATALLGLVLCIADMGRLYGPYGLSAPTNSAIKLLPRSDDTPRPANGTQPRPWPWFCFQTLCRALEFAMGCAMANITKQPVNNRHTFMQHQYAYSLRLKHRESLYI
ncbi:uncharacterized protein [Anabrus simplex]|uniref:uncharacterized protein n=1 Tax=Anabrus simplex TaxID=316456 RepID=UPI0035A27250